MSVPILSTALALTAAAALYAVQPAPVQAQAASPGSSQDKPAAADQQFMKDLGEGNLAEVETGKLAQQKGSKEDVKSFGAMMVKDHTESLQKLQALASRKGVQLPKEPDAKHAAAAKSLQAMNGDSFDKRYASMAVSDHEQTLALLKKVEQGAKDADLRKYAADTTPVVSRHLEHAQKLAGKH